MQGQDTLRGRKHSDHGDITRVRLEEINPSIPVSSPDPRHPAAEVLVKVGDRVGPGSIQRGRGGRTLSTYIPSHH